MTAQPGDQPRRPSNYDYRAHKMSDVPKNERAAFERAKALSQSVFEMADTADYSNLRFVLDIEALIEADLRWKVGDHDLRAIGSLLRVARRIGLDNLLHVHHLLSPYSTSGYTVTAERRPQNRKPKSDDRIPRRYQRALEAYARSSETWAQFQRARFGEQVQELRSQNTQKTAAIIQAGKQYYPSRKKRWLLEQFKQFEAESIQQDFVGSTHLFSILSRAEPRHSLASLPGKRGRPKK